MVGASQSPSLLLLLWSEASWQHVVIAFCSAYWPPAELSRGSKRGPGSHPP